MKKKVVLILGLVFILCVGIGGKYYTDKKEAQKKQILQAEKEIALYIVQNYEDVEEIEFGKFNQTLATGSWHVPVKVNDDNLITFSTFNLTKLDDLGIRYHPETFKLKKRESKVTMNLDEIKVIYWQK